MTAETALTTSNREARGGQAHPPAAIVARSQGEILPPGASWIEAEQACNFSLYSKHAESVVLLLFAADDLDRPLLEFRLDPRVNKTWVMCHCRLGGDVAWVLSPKQALDRFERQDPERNLDRIFANLIAGAPSIKQAETKLQQTQRDLALAELDLRHCDVRSEIDGVVTSRNVNPGNNVQAGHSLLAVRSLTEIWIDANFKETQLADLRIGQRVRCEFDMYGSRHEFDGRITGFTMGTGQTLALLPPQNATGNYVKIVQRLPVRIELTNYVPEKVPLFFGLSVVPYEYYKEPPNGPRAGAVLRPPAPRRTGPTDPTPSPESGGSRK